MHSATDFFTQQERARRRTGLLILYFAAAVVLIMLAVYYALMLAIYLGQGYLTRLPSRLPPFHWWNWTVLAGSVAATGLLVTAGSRYRILSLRAGGGHKVAEMLGARRVLPGSHDGDERLLLNVVEEMAIASGLPVPPVYLLERERAVNAFAAGFQAHQAVICVTFGALKILNRDELQGVVAHEFSHILNGDMRLNIRLMGWLHGILLVGITGDVLLDSLKGVRGGRGRGGQAVLAAWVLAIALYAIGYIGVLFGNLIKAAVSRQREFLADASSVQFTRNPLGLAGALKQVATQPRHGCLLTPRASEASHMFFATGIRGALGPLRTHPSLPQRVLRLEPDFDGNFAAVRRFSRDLTPVPDTRGWRKPSAWPKPPLIEDPAEKLLLSIGAPLAAHAAAARALIDRLPGEIRNAAREPFGARAVLYALLLDGDQRVAASQWQRLEGVVDQPTVETARKLAAELACVPLEARLPLVDLAVSGLGQLSAEQAAAFRDSLLQLVAADHDLSLFELSLLRVVQRAFASPVKLRLPSRGRSPAAAASVVLSALAHAGQADEGAARAAFEQARKMLEARIPGMCFQPASALDMALVNGRLDELACLAPRLKRWIAVGCLAAVSADGRVAVEEAELFRAVAAGLDIPVPLQST